ncbi:MAG: hypothetical protein JNM42_02420 [Propionivibrio sp.]|uniref:hypothetical protein n=1 Tax=Propionivibrio sp. TaxID=2212460 RepID=UPI001A622ECC|nr:hypothetical protein [Propionivibrio sp.]MBL8413271.1 hypothetical protein [Propionivibrio sp.]
MHSSVRSEHRLADGGEFRTASRSDFCSEDRLNPTAGKRLTPGQPGFQSLDVERQREAADPVDDTDEEITFEEIRSPFGVAGDGQRKRTDEDGIGDSWRAISSEVAPILKPAIARIGS